MRNQKSGYTLIELIITVVVIAIVAMLSERQIQEWVVRYQAKKALALLVSDFSKTRSLATSYSRPPDTTTNGPQINQSAMVISPNEYRVIARNGNNLSTNWPETGDTEIKKIRLPGNIKIMTINGETFTGNRVIAFTSSGKVKTGGNVELTPLSRENCIDTNDMLGNAVIRIGLLASTHTPITYRLELNAYGETRVCATFAGKSIVMPGI